MDFSSSTPFYWPILAAGEAPACVWESVLSFWNKTGPGQLVRRVLQRGRRDAGLPVKGRQQERFPPEPAVRCHGEGGASLLLFSAFLLYFFGRWRPSGILALFVFFLRRWEQGVPGPGWQVWGRVERQPSPGVIRKL